MSYSKPATGAENSTGEIEFLSLFSYASEDQSPFVDPAESGIRIAIEKPQISQNRLQFELLVTFRFENSFVNCFQDLYEAVLLLIEHPSLDLTLQQNLSDPHKDYVGYEGDNFDPKKYQTLEGSCCSYCKMEMTLPYDPSLVKEQLYLRAVLATHTSNVLSIAVDENIEVRSYLNDRPYIVQSEADFIKSLNIS